MERRLAFVVSHVPIPWVSGVVFQEWRDLSLLAETRRVHLLALDHGDLRTPAAMEAVESLRAVCAEVAVFGRERSHKVIAGLRRARGALGGMPSTMAHNVRGDVRAHLRGLLVKHPGMDVYLSNFFVASVIAGLRRRGRAVVRLHNLESAYTREALRTARSPLAHPLLALDLPLTRMAERRVFGGLRADDTILTCTAQDRETLSRRYRTRARVEHLPLTPPYAQAEMPERTDAAEGVTEPMVVFSGILSNPLNVEGIAWFVERVWPRVRERAPGARLVVAGREPNATVLGLGSATGVTVIANPRDMGEILAGAAVAVAPTFHGAGVKQKCLEAFAWRIPLVATPKGAEGLDAVPGEEYLLADTAERFAEHVVALLGDPDLRRRVGEHGRRYVEAHHGDDVRRAVLARALEG